MKELTYSNSTKQGVMPATDCPLDTPASLAKALSTTPQTILNWFHGNKIPARVACGRIIRFDRAEVIEALKK